VAALTNAASPGSYLDRALLTAGSVAYCALNKNAILLFRGQTLTQEPQSATIDRWTA